MRASLSGLLLCSVASSAFAAEVAVDAKTGAAGETNPYSESGDATQECYAWAADGQCGLNPGHMLVQCKYSCWEWYKYRRETYKDAPIDKYFDCNAWSKNGECGKNADFMRSNCPESCKEKGYDPPPPPPEAAGGKKKKKKKKAKKAKADAEGSD